MRVDNELIHRAFRFIYESGLLDEHLLPDRTVLKALYDVLEADIVTTALAIYMDYRIEAITHVSVLREELGV